MSLKGSMASFHDTARSNLWRTHRWAGILRSTEACAARTVLLCPAKDDNDDLRKEGYFFFVGEIVCASIDRRTGTIAPLEGSLAALARVRTSSWMYWTNS